jgi:hypothetical protein
MDHFAMRQRQDMLRAYELLQAEGIESPTRTQVLARVRRERDALLLASISLKRQQGADDASPA